MIRILLDQGLAPGAASILRDMGWDALHVLEVGLWKAGDVEILDYCRAENRVCVTLDHDFHAHLALLGTQGPSVVLLRAEGLKAVAQAAMIRAIWEACEQELSTGAAVSADTRAIRVRRLPLLSPRAGDSDE